MKTKGHVTLWMFVFATIGCGDTGYKGRTVEVTSTWHNGNVKEERVSLKGDTVEVISYHNNFKIQTRGRVVSRDGADLKIECWVYICRFSDLPLGYEPSLREGVLRRFFLLEASVFT